MDKLQNNNIRNWSMAISLVSLVLLILFVGLSVGDAGSADAERFPQPACIGKVEIAHEIGDTTGMEIVSLPPQCQFGAVLLSADSLIEGQPVIVNYNLHQGELVIRTTFLAPVPGPVLTQVSYAVFP